MIEAEEKVDENKDLLVTLVALMIATLFLTLVLVCLVWKSPQASKAGNGRVEEANKSRETDLLRDQDKLTDRGDRIA